MRPRIGVRLVAAGLSLFVAVGEAAQPRSEAQRVLKAGEDLYKSGDYAAAAGRFDAALAADSRNAEALLFAGLTALRKDDPKKAADLWGRLQRDAGNPKLAEDAGRMRTILLREVAERAAKSALTQERQLSAQKTDPRTIAVATFRNAGTAGFATLGKALAAMLIDNLGALPNVRVLEREQVQALEQEAALATSGLAEKSTAVRAGKLLRAGRVGAGSHTDWTASPTHLALNALLVDVDAGTTIAEGKSEALATEFYKLVPEIASSFSGALGEPAGQLPNAIRQRLEKPHTKSLPAVLAYGSALDALDRHDAEGAKQACKDVEKADPNFELAKKSCGFIPVTWLSMNGVVAAMEPTAFAMAGSTATSGSLWPAAIGAVAIGGAIGGAYAAFHGGGVGGAPEQGPTPAPPGTAAPDLTGVVNRNVVGGSTATIDMQCHDPDGSVTTISNPTAGPGGTFTQQSGTTATARYQQPTSPNQTGQSFPVSFVCTDSSNPPMTTRRDATIRVVSSQPQATPTPVATPTPRPPVCRNVGDACTNDSQCCARQGLDCQNFEGGGSCCVALGGVCDPGNEGSDCCFVSGGLNCEAIPVDGPSIFRCCLPSGAPCVQSADCCTGSCFSGTCQGF